MPSSLYSALELMHKYIEVHEDDQTIELALFDLGARIAREYRGKIHLCLQEVIGNPVGGEPLSDHMALACFTELGLRAAYPTTWEEALHHWSKAAEVADKGQRFGALLVGQLLVLVEKRLGQIAGVIKKESSEDMENTVALLEAISGASFSHLFTEDDLTPESRKQGAQDELQKWDKFEVWLNSWLTFEEIPENATVLDSTLVEKPKLKKSQDGSSTGSAVSKDTRLKPGEVLTCKSRLCPKGFQDLDRPDEQRIDAPTASRTSLLVFLHVTVTMCFVLAKGDIEGAFLNGVPLPADRYLYLHMPTVLFDLGLVPYQHSYRRLRKAAYGLAEAPRYWARKLRSVLLQLDWVQCCLDTNLYVKRDENNSLVAMCLIYVDDLLVSSTTDKLTISLLDQIGKELPLGAAEDPAFGQNEIAFCGYDLSITKDEIRVHQEPYVSAKVNEEMAATLRSLKGPLKETGTAISRANRLLTP